ncbi:MAG: DNA primase [Bacteroidetes bacterium]|nr:DNA primase [Bacteroidota bacterium]
MIPRQTVDKIIESARIEDIVGEFVTLKKRGVNLIGNCPFHNEKTPSFTVSPSKNIYKCFGCGKAGTPVNFVMTHLSLSYSDGLKWLANKYGIEVIEKETTPEEIQQRNERESLLIVMTFAQRYYNEVMHNTDEGKSIGLSYLTERGLTSVIIEKFGLGYSLNEKKSFTKAAINKGYLPDYLVKTGMAIVSKNFIEGTLVTEKDIFDRYNARVMFPIHDEGGRVVGFGGRILGNDKKTAKYINSPGTELYSKNKILYGLWFAKKSIQQTDKVFLVEGYMDVIAMHQSGYENVVASSGTSLTVDQIKALKRFTNNIVVLYDGDAAGQNAMARAIPMLLEDGMNVRLLFFPDNDDPDSYSRKVSNTEFVNYVETKTEDFLIYQARKLNSEFKNDPIKRAGVIKEIIENIALIPDTIIRSIYVKECAQIMDLQEQILQNEINKLILKAKNKNQKTISEPINVEEAPTFENVKPEPKTENTKISFEAEEKKIIELLVAYGNVYIQNVTIQTDDSNDEKAKVENIDITLGEYIRLDFNADGICFENPTYETIYEAYQQELHDGNMPDLNFFKNHANQTISNFVIEHIINVPSLSNNYEKKFEISTPKEINNLNEVVFKTLLSYKEKKIRQYISDCNDMLKEEYDKTIVNAEILEKLIYLNEKKVQVNKKLGRTVTK